MWFAAAIGWLFGRQRRETRRAAEMAALPEEEKRRRFNEQHAKAQPTRSRHGEFVNGKFVPSE